jgi:hypothetical protein
MLVALPDFFIIEGTTDVLITGTSSIDNARRATSGAALAVEPGGISNGRTGRAL